MPSESDNQEPEKLEKDKTVRLKHDPKQQCIGWLKRTPLPNDKFVTIRRLDGEGTREARVDQLVVCPDPTKGP